MTTRTTVCLAALLAGLGLVSISQSQVDDGSPAAVPAPRWFKGNLHTHSLWSDGNDYPEMIADWYRRQGYHFLALSDHNILSQGHKWIDLTEAAKRGEIEGLARYQARFGHDWVETRTVDERLQVRLKPLNEFRSLVEERGRFLLIEAEEITDRCGDLPVHVNAHNVRDAIKPQGGKTVRETIANNLIAIDRQSQRVGQPMLGHLNHPNFGWGVTAEDMAHVSQERYFEVFNGHPDVHNDGDARHPATERLWDIANTIRLAELGLPPLMALANDDSHNYFGLRGSSPGRGWIQVRARRLTAESLIAAISDGDFYASSGVTLQDVRFSDELGELTIVIEPHGDAKYTTRFIGTLEDFDARHEPLQDDKGEPLPVTQKYSDDVGQVLSTVDGLRPSYRLSGKELYVRAVVTSTERPENPASKNQFQKAWTQPVGWQKRLIK